MPAPGEASVPNGRSPLRAKTSSARDDERAAGDMISAKDHALTGTLIVRACDHPHTLPMAWTAASTRLASSSQNLAKSGWSR